MNVATVAILASSLGLLGSCGSDDQKAGNPVDPTTATTSRPGPTPSVDPSTKGAISLRGDWEAPEADWVVRFEEDGTFTEDYQGLSDFRVGKYEVEGDTVRLIGDDGNTTEGSIDGEKLVFKLGTLTRM